MGLRKKFLKASNDFGVSYSLVWEQLKQKQRDNSIGQIHRTDTYANEPSTS